MDALRAVMVALSIVACSIIYSAILESEELLADGKHYLASREQSDNMQPTGEAFNSITVRDRILTGKSGSFQSPNFPVADHRLDCIWIIRVEPSNKVRLVLMDFDTEPGSDFIFVHDGDTTDHPLLLVRSGSSKPSGIRSTGNTMLIRFVTDNKGTSKGFQANYYSVPSCFNTVYASSGVITSPNYPNDYDNNLRCDWLIGAAESECVLLELIDVDTEEERDVIQVYDGDTDRSPFLRQYSGDQRGRIMVLSSTTNSTLIRFISDNSRTRSGFAIRFLAGKESDLIRYVVAKYPDAFQDDSDDESRTSHFDDESDDTDSELNEELLSYFSDIMKAMNESSS